MTKKRLLELTALAMIGEGVVGLLFPRRHLLLWRIGPRPCRNAVDELAQHPDAMRLAFLAEAGLGLWLARRQIEP